MTVNIQEEKEVRRISLSSINPRDYFSNPQDFEGYRETCSPKVRTAIDYYVQRYCAGEDFEPIQVMEDPANSGNYSLIEGMHRVSVIRAEGGIEVLAVVESPESLEVPAFMRKKD